MARRSRMSILKRQRELKKAEKAAHKRAKRHGLVMQPEAEPMPTVGVGQLLGGTPPEQADNPDHASAEEPAAEEQVAKKEDAPQEA